MSWHLTADLSEYLSTAGEFLRSRPVENTVAVTVVETLRTRGPDNYGRDTPLFGWWQPDGSAIGAAFVETPPYPLVLTAAGADSIASLAGALAGAGRVLAGIGAAPDVAERFAAQWCRRTGAEAKVAMRQRLFRPGKLVPPAQTPAGLARVARAGDRSLLLTWFEAFTEEAGTGDHNLAAAVHDRLSYGGLLLWEADGSWVSLAGLSRQAASTVRIGPVYTPPRYRRRGYGAAVTAAASQRAQQQGASEVVLFTDLANPTSNALYQRLGYRAVQDRLILSFSTATT